MWKNTRANSGRTLTVEVRVKPLRYPEYREAAAVSKPLGQITRALQKVDTKGIKIRLKTAPQENLSNNFTTVTHCLEKIVRLLFFSPTGFAPKSAPTKADMFCNKASSLKVTCDTERQISRP